FFTDNRGGDGSGTGIGLALTKNIIDSLNGSITVDSETGKGTAFHVELPIRQTAAQAYTPGSTEFAQAEYTDTDTQTESMETHAEERKDAPLVLVMEDNKDVADYMGTLLEKEYNVMYASNGKEGLEKAHERIPDLIITDLMMPEMDGLEVCRNIRADELVNHVPIIVVTAKITEEDRVKGLQCGADAYLSNPFNAEELMTRAQKLLEQRRLLREKYAAQAQAALATVLAENTETERETMARETTPEDMFITKIDKAIDDMLVAFEDVTVASLAEKTGVTARQLHRKLTATVGLNPNAYIQQKKIGKAQKLLMDNPEIPLKNVAYDCGFSDYSYFTRVFKNLTGISPGEMRKSAKGQGH
ncbi:MAG: response regulator, partial [Alloprevotella sp.]